MTGSPIRVRHNDREQPIKLNAFSLVEAGNFGSAIGIANGACRSKSSDLAESLGVAATFNLTPLTSQTSTIAGSRSPRGYALDPDMVIILEESDPKSITR